jgi:hypothetical protein
MNVDRRAIIGHVTSDFRVGPRGGIGRRDGFKIRCLHGRVSSSLTEGTIPANMLQKHHTSTLKPFGERRGIDTLQHIPFLDIAIPTTAQRLTFFFFVKRAIQIDAFAF